MSNIRVTIDSKGNFTELKDDFFVISHTSANDDIVHTTINGTCTTDELASILLASTTSIMSSLIKRCDLTADDVVKLQEELNKGVLEELFTESEGDSSGENNTTIEQAESCS
ncbi:hypothetical protein M3Y14_34115 (plasmid) [Bacillus thuringiensis]|uniref:hypothetical protein n=1 Tax=Bacillus thuringiensis TaxID=1428 RepID=UPI002224A6CE|nr:hypothetical protein [Bacillus thuringiensis]UYX56285.1 hypothetical protein M3Y14_34115 [Bacillus thuringiensis]